MKLDIQLYWRYFSFRFFMLAQSRGGLYLWEQWRVMSAGPENKNNHRVPW